MSSACGVLISGGTNNVKVGGHHREREGNDQI